MAIDILQTVEVIEVMENFIEWIRPEEHIRPELDFGYRIDGQSIIVFEIRPQWDKPEIIMELPYAKATFIKAKNHWKIFWMRANLNWENYQPQPTVKTIREFTRIIDEDKHHCFKG